MSSYFSFTDDRIYFSLDPNRNCSKITRQKTTVLIQTRVILVRGSNRLQLHSHLELRKGFYHEELVGGLALVEGGRRVDRQMVGIAMRRNDHHL